VSVYDKPFAAEKERVGLMSFAITSFIKKIHSGDWNACRVVINDKNKKAR
jgi:hypothetical protein